MERHKQPGCSENPRYSLPVNLSAAGQPGRGGGSCQQRYNQWGITTGITPAVSNPSPGLVWSGSRGASLLPGGTPKAHQPARLLRPSSTSLLRRPVVANPWLHPWDPWALGTESDE